MVHKNAAMKRPRTPRREAEPVQVDQVDPLTEQVATELAGGDKERLLIGGVRSIIVLNFPGQRFGKTRPIARGR